MAKNPIVGPEIKPLLEDLEVLFTAEWETTDYPPPVWRFDFSTVEKDITSYESLILTSFCGGLPTEVDQSSMDEMLKFCPNMLRHANRIEHNDD